MGFWSKVKGVFGRIGRGIKTGYDWINRNKEKVKEAVSDAADIITPQYAEKVRQGLNTGEQYLNKASNLGRKIGVI